jgi:levansucrase
VTVSALHTLNPEQRLRLRLHPSKWEGATLTGITPSTLPCPPVFTRDDIHHIDPDLTFWDIWPIQLDNGDLVELAAGSLWVMLCAPRTHDPDDRHNVARLRLLLKTDGAFVDCGDLLPDGFSPGSREWSGSTRLDPKTNEITLWFTAAGRRGEAKADFEQRLFHVRGKLDLSGPKPRVIDWFGLTQSVVNSGEFYADLLTTQGALGQIKGFRDPYWFRDPLDGSGYLLFTGSHSADRSTSNFDGVIGLARANDALGRMRFTLEAPILDAYGLASELERPHMFVKDGLYYLFWSTQSHIFDPNGPVGPTGLYGVVGPSVFGPFEPINGTGLVLANPPEEPYQAYAWQVVPNLDIVSFVDFWGLKGKDPKSDPVFRAERFGGSIAPVTKISLDGATSRVIQG